MVKLDDHKALIAELGGGAKVAEHIGEMPVTVRAMSRRNRIPPEHWPAFIMIAASQGIFVTAEWLMQTTPPRKRPGAAA